MRGGAVLVGLALLMLAATPKLASAHPMRLGLLTLSETQAGVFDVRLRMSGSERAPTAGAAVLPAHCELLGPPRISPITSGQVTRLRVDCGSRGVVGHAVGIGALEDQGIQVVVQVHLTDGSEHRLLVDDREPTAIVPGEVSRMKVLEEYFVIGVEHILEGIDHLAFVLALLLLVTSRRRLLITITAFTAGHSVTLALAVLGVLGAPTAPVEACIAASVLLLAAELCRAEGSPPTLTVRFPWLVAGGFGLLHGLGFAGALTDIGLPATAVPTALLAFNLGVEVGQLLFVAACFALLAGARRLSVPPRTGRLLPYAIGVAAMYWLCERVAAFWA